MSKTLIVIDMQNDFIDGALGTEEAKKIVPRVMQKIEQYRSEHHDIIFTADSHSENYLSTPEGKALPIKHCITFTDGWKINSKLNTTDSRILPKSTFGYVEWNRFYDFDFTTIEIIGLCTDICVVSNALILKNMFPDAKIIVDASCCAGTTPEKHKAAIEVMKSCQIDIIGEEE